MKFKFQIIVKITGVIIVIIAIAMIPAMLVSLWYREGAAAKAFAAAIAPMVLVGALLIFITKPLTDSLRMREGVLIVTQCWVMASILGALPYIISGAAPNFIDALFESASGFSTTGATLFSDLSHIPKGLLFWRSMTHWLGGMGILVFAISILPALGIGALNLAKAEAPGPTLDKAATRISDNAKILYMIYLSLSVIEFVILLISGMNPYDAAIHTFASMGTGGLSSYDQGIAEFGSFAVKLTISSFCLFASVNFIAYSALINRKWKEFINEPELKAFIGAIIGFSLLIGLALWLSGVYPDPSECFGQAFLQTGAFISTSGYVSADYRMWPLVCQWLLFLLLLCGGCSSSTAGGMKLIRVLVMFKLIYRNFYKRLHPRAVVSVKLGGRVVSAENASNITVFVLMYFTAIFAGSLILSIDGNDIVSTVSAVAAMLANSSSGFGKIGYLSSFGIFSPPARLFLTFLMIAGRLELFTVFIIMTPAYWRTDRQ
ncbi:MAG: TrkH family potassium uptake protein [Clostridiales Family XIII bacterium]|jgi:trk system potassium uptake protein TrkH|nr:TrkH family potassium uptake protein [Clostridiales Family XIII bacterium]